MDNAMIGKIEKAKRYASQPERVTFHSLTADFQGDNSGYTTTLSSEGWTCTCPGFQSIGICPHIMTLERVLGPMLKREPLPYAAGQNIVSDVEKAARYATELHRIRLRDFDVTFAGDNGNHTVDFEDGHWDCTCDFFQTRNVCCHTMALERILGDMLRVENGERAAS